VNNIHITAAGAHVPAHIQLSEDEVALLENLRQRLSDGRVAML
jgi:nanoRNase/pAp phosphatase (c-di-AMP/oligoRNAs hydrolase)